MLLNGSALNSVTLNGSVELTITEICALAMSQIERLAQAEIDAQIRLTRVDKDVLELAKPWRKQYRTNNRGDHEPGWDWQDEYYRRGQKSSGVTLAIWADAVLCGLMIGQVSDGRLHATIHFLEGNPGENPLKGNVVNIATGYIEAVGLLVGCSTVRLSRPIPDLIPFYKEFGYTIEERKNKIVVFLDKPMLDLQQNLPADDPLAQR
jgi:hypothetical protein